MPFYRWVLKKRYLLIVLVTNLFKYLFIYLVAPTVKNPPAMLETWVWSLGWEDRWRRTQQPIPIFLPGESLWTEESGGLQFFELQRVRHKHGTFIYLAVPCLSCGMWVLVPWPGIKARVLATGPPGKSQLHNFQWNYWYLCLYIEVTPVLMAAEMLLLCK